MRARGGHAPDAPLDFRRPPRPNRRSAIMREAAMRPATKLILSACAGLVAGGAGMAALKAQTSTAPAYIIAEVRVSDAEAMKPYGEKLPATLAPFEGTAIVRNGKSVPLEGTPLNGNVAVFRFPSFEKAQAFWNSPAYQAIVPIRQKAATSRIYLVEGVPQ